MFKIQTTDPKCIEVKFINDTKIYTNTTYSKLLTIYCNKFIFWTHNGIYSVNPNAKRQTIVEAQITEKSVRANLYVAVTLPDGTFYFRSVLNNEITDFTSIEANFINDTKLHTDMTYSKPLVIYHNKFITWTHNGI